MKFRVVSYFTIGTIYETIMQNYLRDSVERLGVNYCIFPRHDLGNWKYNVMLQPEVIWTALKTFPTENIVWMDADSVVRYYPSLFEEIPTRCDIAVYYMEHADHYGGVPPGVDMPRPELNTGVIYFKNSVKTLKLVEEWMAKSARTGANHRKELDKLIVSKVLEEDLSYFKLPRAYAYLAEREDGSLPCVQMKDPHIVQFCASAQGKEDLYHLRNFDQEDTNGA